jgi:hypothetical protein
VKLNSRWHNAKGFHPVARITNERTVEDSRQVRDRHGVFRAVKDAVDEVKWAARRREGSGWRNGARVSGGKAEAK